MNNKQKVALVCVILLAVFFRYYQIATLPGGLFPDEAANGIDINSMQQGELQPFYERGNGREALFFYMLWGSVEAFGKGPWQHHIVSALVGVMSVLLCFLFTRRLFRLGVSKGDEAGKNRATNIALLAAFLMAVSTWHIVLSRTAFRANLIPLFTTLTLYLGLCAFMAKERKKQLLFAFLTGASFALGFYTYIAYRILVPIVMMALVWPFLASFRHQPFWQNIKNFTRKYFSLKIFFLTGFIIFIFPLAHYFYTHPGSFIGRSGQVSVFNPELYTYDGASLTGTPPTLVVLEVVGEVARKSLLGFFTRGDLNWRHNISGVPFLSQLVSPFFGVGLALITLFGIWYFFAPNKRSGYWKYFLLTGWFWGMLLPVVTTAEGIPHGLRSIGMIPPVFIISAWALYGFGKWVVKAHNHMYEHWKGGSSWRSIIVIKAFKVAVACFVVALILQAYFLYFVYAANSPENYYYFRSDLTSVSNYLKQRCDKDNTYLVLDKFSVQTTDYMTSDRYGNFSDPCNVPYKHVDPENSWELKGLKPGDEIIFTQSSIFDTKKFKQHHPEAKLKIEVRNKFNQAIMAVYGVD